MTAALCLGVVIGAGIMVCVVALAIARGGRGLGRLLLGTSADLTDEGFFEYRIVHLTDQLGGRCEQRKLILQVTGPGVFMEIDLGDGTDLLGKIHEGRYWLLEEVVT